MSPRSKPIVYVASTLEFFNRDEFRSKDEIFFEKDPIHEYCGNVAKLPKVELIKYSDVLLFVPECKDPTNLIEVGIALAYRVSVVILRSDSFDHTYLEQFDNVYIVNDLSYAISWCKEIAKRNNRE